MKKLAICIPTFNRAILLDRLLKSIPKLDDIVVSICDDGSNDHTSQIIKNYQSKISIKYIYQKNKGRASALRKSILNCRAQFYMIVDSDDYFEKEGLQNIIKSLNKNQSTKFFVFPIKILEGYKSKVVSLSRIPKTSYLSLRYDYKIKYDLQEVIESQLLLDILYDDPLNIRRIPTSYLWFKASLREECLPVDISPVKIKEYLSDGMTKNLLPLKIRNPKYMFYKYKIAVEDKNYRSKFYRIISKIQFYRYGFHYKNFKIEKYSDVPFYLIGYTVGFFDLLRLVIFLINKFYELN